MPDMIAVATAFPEAYNRARDLLAQFGHVSRTDYYNVLILVPDDPGSFMERLAAMVDNVPEVMNVLSRVMPCTDTFLFADPAEFESAACEIVRGWIPRLCGKSFHVRMHRRGFKGRISSLEEERFLDETVLSATTDEGAAARIDFEDPDMVIDVETVGNRALLSIWTREELRRYPFLRPE
jgi:tRNA(Ser,Leu) C12 N-acetylase TAN1